MSSKKCVMCGGKLTEVDLNDDRWDYIDGKTYYDCDKCGRRWLYSDTLTCPVLLESGSG